MAHLLDTCRDVRAEFLVNSLTWCKERQGVQHEFLVAHLTQSRCLVVERSPAGGAKVVRIASTSSHSMRLAADDAVKVIPSHDFQAFLGGRNARTVTTVDFEGVRVFDFARLVALVSESTPLYDIKLSTCYWFASTIMGVARGEFTEIGEHPTAAGRSGTLRNASVHHENTTQIQQLRASFRAQINAAPNPIGPIEAASLEREQMAQEETQAAQEEAQAAQEEAQRAREEARAAQDEVRRLQNQIRQMAQQLQASQGQNQAGHRRR